MLKNFCRAALDLVFPPRCPVCRTCVKACGLFCPSCWHKLIHVRKVPIDKHHIHALDVVYALTNYHDGMKTLIQRLKYQKQTAVLMHMHRVLTEAMPLEVLRDSDFFIPVPLHAVKQRERGFNQTREIYGKWVKENGFCWLDALERRRETQPQYALTLEERRHNMTKAFALSIKMDLQRRNVVLLDDIFTTGTTMEACAKVLRKAGASRIIGLALASDA